jgi:hypothetical protein
VATPRSAARTRVAPGRARHTPAPKGGAERKFALSPLERELLLRACARYRSSLPSYLASSREELRILARILRKLR